MLNDRVRNAWFQKHIHSLLQDKIFIDVGAGTGILSAYALEAGARFGYPIEISKQASIVGNHILKCIGYKNKFKWYNEDFEKVVTDKADVVLAEQVGPGLFDELQIKIWKHYNKIYGSDYVSIPDELVVDLHIFDGNKMPYVDKIIHQDTSLPNGFYDTLKKLSIQPDEIVTNFISINKDTVDKTIENTISLNAYESATLVFVNKIGYQKDYLHLTDSSTQYWKFPPRLFIKDCSLPIRIFWNPVLSNTENPCDDLYMGYWDVEQILN